MRRAFLCLTLLGLLWALRPTAEYLFRPRDELLLDQLRGHGCQFQDSHPGVHSLNPLTTFSIRHPEFACPLWASAHLAATRHSPAFRARVVAAFDAAILRQPADFDTGDGVIHYAAELKTARDAILAGP